MRSSSQCHSQVPFLAPLLLTRLFPQPPPFYSPSTSSLLFDALQACISHSVFNALGHSTISLFTQNPTVWTVPTSSRVSVSLSFISPGEVYQRQQPTDLSAPLQPRLLMRLLTDLFSSCPPPLFCFYADDPEEKYESTYSSADFSIFNTTQHESFPLV